MASQYVDKRGRIRHCKPRAKKPEDAPGEYILFLDLHILAWLAAHAAWCMSGRVEKIAEAVNRNWRHYHDTTTTLKTLHKLKKRGFVRCDKPRKRVVLERVPRRRGAKKIYKRDHWEITPEGYEHLRVEMSARFYSPDADSASHKHLLKMLKMARFEIIPEIQKLKPPAGGHKVYYICDFIKSTSVFELPRILDYAKRADNPCAYFVRSCLGPMPERDDRRAKGWILAHPFFKKRPDLVDMFLAHCVCSMQSSGLSKLGVAMRVAKYVASYFNLRDSHEIKRPKGPPIDPNADLMGAAFASAARMGALPRKKIEISA